MYKILIAICILFVCAPGMAAEYYPLNVFVAGSSIYTESDTPTGTGGSGLPKWMKDAAPSYVNYLQSRDELRRNGGGWTSSNTDPECYGRHQCWGGDGSSTSDTYVGFKYIQRQDQIDLFIHGATYNDITRMATYSGDIDVLVTKFAAYFDRIKALFPQVKLVLIYDHPTNYQNPGGNPQEAMTAPETESHETCAPGYVCYQWHNQNMEAWITKMDIEIAANYSDWVRTIDVFNQMIDENGGDRATVHTYVGANYTTTDQLHLTCASAPCTKQRAYYDNFMDAGLQSAYEWARVERPVGSIQ